MCQQRRVPELGLLREERSLHAEGVCEAISGGIGPAGQVCGCDNKTHSGFMAAHQARVSLAYFGACE
jgi:hypothetical protein